MSEPTSLCATSAALQPDENGEPVGDNRCEPERLNKVTLPATNSLRGFLERRPGDRPADPLQTKGRRRAEGISRTGCAGCKDGMRLFPFTMAFQPIVDLQDRRIDAYEALVRGPAAEGAGYVLGQVNQENVYAFDQACRVKAIELAARLGTDRQLSINFLPNAVYEPRACIQLTLETAARTGFPLDRLTFEILESEAIGDTEHLLNIIREYRRSGFKIALDDFATGYSGLARLAELKPDIAKIDRVLARDCDKDRHRLAIIAAMLRFGSETGIKIIVEGVERVEEVEALCSVGVRYIQGFYFAKPLFEGMACDGDIRWPSFLGFS